MRLNPLKVHIKKLPFDKKHNQINNKNEEWEWQYLDEDGNSVEGN